MKHATILLIIFVLITTTVSAGKVDYLYQLMGESMRPTYNPDYETGLYRVQTITGTEARINDVVCFNPDWRDFQKGNYNNFRYVCHRVIDKNETHILTKGDANNIADQWAKNSAVALIVKELIRRL